MFRRVDMEKFIAEALFLTASHLADMRRRASKIDPCSQVPSQVRRNVHSISNHVLLTQCKAIGLSISVQHIERFGRDLSRGLTVEQFKTALDTISQTIQHELQRELFLYVRPEKAEYYLQKTPLFGQEVFDAFPSAATDIMEAGKCLALDRASACVFHLMRAMEVGLRALAKRLRIRYAPNWGQYLGRIDAQIRQHKTQKPRWFARNEAFFTEAAIHLGSVKNAWRNPTMHLEKTYTPEQADEIFASVRSFLRHLATKLRE